MIEKKPHIINLIYSIFLIAIGLAGFFLRYREAGDFQFTALIPALFGVILLFFTNGINRQNKIISHIAVLLTLILTVFTLVMFVTNLGEGFMASRKGIIFILVILSSLFVLTLYITRFIRISKS